MDTTTSKLTAEAVEAVFMVCLYQDGEDTTNHVKAVGVMNNVGFDPVRLESHRGEIVELLNLLPEAFHEKTGGGMTFLNACVDREGHQWGEHINVEQLMLLGLAIKRVRYCLPKELWSALPGGMPYFMVTAA
jgi:hypothetical protein